MNVILALLLTHASTSRLIFTIIIIFGSVILTLSYIGWKKYNWKDYDEGKNIDHSDDQD